MIVADYTNQLTTRFALEMDLVEDEVEFIDRHKKSVFQQFENNRKRQSNKYSELNIYNIDQTLHYYIFLQRSLFGLGSLELAEKLYYFLRKTYCIDIHPSRLLPEYFLLVHPIGTVIGNASFADFLVVYQNVTVGGSPKLEYPTIGQACVLYGGSKIIGRSVLGDNVTVGAGVIINNEQVPDNTILYIDHNNLRQVKHNTHSNKARFFT